MAFAYRTLIADAQEPSAPLEDPTVTGMVDVYRVGAPAATQVRADWGEDGWRLVQVRPAPQDPNSTFIVFVKEV